MQHILRCSVLLTLLCSALGHVYQRFADLPTNIDFDFVIVGGGTAGSVVASRLSEDPNFQVLVIEAGPSNDGILSSEVPFFVFDLLPSQFVWNFTSPPQSGLNGRPLQYARGRVLGGSSSINDMFYTRGSSDDYDRFARVTGDSGWSWQNVQRYFERNERLTAPADNHDTTGQFDPSAHSTTGMTLVSLPGFAQEIDGRVIQATEQLDKEFPFLLDMNAGKPLGLGWLQCTIGSGARSSAATSYLNQPIVQRPNLHVLLNTQVTRLLSIGQGNELTFRTVELVSAPGTLAQVNASKEIILSAGTIGTPNILLHSGVGDRTELQNLGIKSVIHLPSVGKNLTDHPVVSFNWATTSNNTLDGLLGNMPLRQQELSLWQETRTGPLTTNGINHVAWRRLPNNSTILKRFPDPSAGRNTPHIELTVGSGMLSFTPGHLIGMGAAVVTPMSRGSVSLRSMDVLSLPVVDPAMLSSDFDVMVFREAFESAKRFFAAPAWRSFVLGLVEPWASATPDQLDAIIRNSTFPAGHIVGTAAMSPRGADYGVVDPDLHLKHSSGLRVVDASVMPFVTCGHTQAPVYVIAERAADLIKQDWRSS